MARGTSQMKRKEEGHVMLDMIFYRSDSVIFHLGNFLRSRLRNV